MLQRSIVADLVLKGLSAREIHGDPEATAGPDAVAYSSVMLDLCEPQLTPFRTGLALVGLPRGLDDSDQTNVSGLENWKVTIFGSTRV
jgi:hypothetical protein